jgi:hypothetical protein
VVDHPPVGLLAHPHHGDVAGAALERLGERDGAARVDEPDVTAAGGERGVRAVRRRDQGAQRDLG